MINKRTVFILGAGASFPYGFPLGVKLRQDIMRVEPQFLHDAKYFGKDRLTRLDDDVQTFRSAFSQSKAQSIDAFLANRIEYSEVGRLAIARVLLEYEKSNALFDDSNTDDWYGALFGSMRCSFDQFLRNRVSFVTFNYDRSLELALLNFVMHTYAKSEVEAFDILKNFPIVHVYGSLGSLDSREKNFVPYGGGGCFGTAGFMSGDEHRARRHEALRWVSSAAKQIKVIPEHRDDAVANPFLEAKMILDGARRLVILGFAFDDLNMSRLSPELSIAAFRLQSVDHGYVPNFAATVFGMADAEITRVCVKLISGAQDLKQSRMYNMTSLQMLRHTGIHICD